MPIEMTQVITDTIALAAQIAAVQGTVNTIQADTNELDDAATAGLTGTPNSLAYRVAEIERHLHVRERWFGKLAVQTATDWADDTLNPYIAISGNDAYGSDPNDEALVLGTDDTPVIVGSVYFDLHRIFITAVTSDSVWKLRIIYGTDTMAAAIAAGQYSEVMVKFDSVNPQQSAGIPIDVQMPRCLADTQIWVQAWNATDNAQISFFVGLHEYTG